MVPKHKMIVKIISNFFVFVDEWPDVSLSDCISDKELLEMAKQLETEMEELLDDEVSDDNASSHLREYVEANMSESTKKKTEQVSKRFCQWLRDRNAGPENESDNTILSNMEPEKLDTELGTWLMDLKKADGSLYEPGSVVSYYGSIKRKLEQLNYKCDIGQDPIFKLSRKVLSSKKKELKRSGHGNLPKKAEPLQTGDEKLLWETGQFGISGGEQLQNFIWYSVTKGFGFRGVQESKSLKWGDVTLKTGETGEFIEFNERTTKTRNGESGHRAFQPKIFATNTDKCPVTAYKLFAKKRPESMLLPDAPFFISPITSPINDEIWYKNLPMGINKLASIMKTMANKAGLKGRFTNHSVRKTMCSNLLHSGVHPNDVAQLSGHKNVASLNSYATASMQKQLEMSNILNSTVTSSTDPIQTPAKAQKSAPVTEPVLASIPQNIEAMCTFKSQYTVSTSTTAKKNENALGKFAGVLANCHFNGNVTFNFGK